MENIFSRTEMLIGKEAVDRLKKKRVAVFGVGGVGGYAVEALARSGIGHLTLIDNDTISPTNINRQIIALHSTVGQKKVQVAKERILDINPQCEVEEIELFFTTDSQFDFSRFDYVIDAIDSVTGKIELAVRCEQANVPIISAMGAGNKLDATAFEVSDLFKTEVCPLARVMRRELKQRGIKRLKVVYSKEEPIVKGERLPASISFVPSVMGLIIAGEVIKDLIKGSE